MILNFKNFYFAFGISLFLNACSTSGSREVASFVRDEPKMCAAIRGNGELMLAHITSLAMLTEEFGLFDGLAGGSSATYSMFLYESVAQNPSLENCSREKLKNQKCSRIEIAERASLLLKSMYAYIDQVKSSKDVELAMNAYRALEELKVKSSHLNFEVLSTQPQSAMELLKHSKDLHKLRMQIEELLASPNLSALVNPRFVSVLVRGEGDPVLGLSPLQTTPKDLATKAFLLKEAKDMISQFGSFKADSKNILFRPGVLSFQELGKRMGLIANFYAGRGNLADNSDYKEWELRQVLNSCAARTKGKSWFEIQQSEKQCTQKLVSLITEYNATHDHESVKYPRVFDRVGEKLSILGIVAALKNSTMDFKDYSNKYLGNPNFKFTENDFDLFHKISFAYFGRDFDVQRLEENSKLNEFKNDYKMQRVMTVANPTWEEILTLSPAEPGLNALTIAEDFKVGAGNHFVDNRKKIDPKFPPEHASTAGWADLSPTLALKSIGCDDVIYVTRRETEGNFLYGVVKQLGADENDLHQLYSLENAQSSFSQALKNASGVWCTDWNASDLAAPNFEALDNNIFKSTQLEALDTENLKSLLLRKQSRFNEKISSPKYIGCGGTAPVKSGHLSNEFE